MGYRTGNRTLIRFGCVNLVALPCVFESQIHRVFPVIQINNVYGNILNGGGILIVGKDLECGYAGGSGGTGNLTSRGVQTHPGGKSAGPEMSRVTGGLDPVAKGFTLRSGSIGSGGNRRGGFTGAVAEEGNIC